MAFGMTKAGSRLRLLAWKEWLADNTPIKLRLIRDEIQNASTTLTLPEWLAFEATFPGYTPLEVDPLLMSGPTWANNHWVITTGPLTWEAEGTVTASEDIGYAIWTAPDPSTGDETVVAAFKFDAVVTIAEEHDLVTKSFGFSAELCGGNDNPDPPGEPFRLMVDVDHNNVMTVDASNNNAILWKDV
jgi:hypothetical protein